MELPRNIAFVLERLEEKGFEAYVVGGCVRNYLLGLPRKDFDVTTSASPEEIKSAFFDFRTIDTGIKYGTVTVISEGEPVEITTYRIDGEYADGRRPDNVSFSGSLEEDLKRRDFTVNAIAYNPKNGIIDLFGGLTDLKNKVIRAIGNPDRRFNEDGLRILRALRFASCCGLEIEKETADSIHRNRRLLEKIAPERISSELNKLLCGDCGQVLREFHDVFGVFLPEIEKCVGFEQHTRYHNRDVFEHTVAAVEAIEPIKRLRLAMLLHDIGKPDYFTLAPDGTGHFKGHANGSTEIAESFLKRMKYDNETAERVICLIKHHDMVIENDERLIKRYLNRFGEEMFFDIIKVHIADDSAKDPQFMSRIEKYHAAEETAKEMIRKKECFSLKNLAVNGNDIKEMGYNGAEIGEALQFLLTLVIENKCVNNKDELLSRLKKGDEPFEFN